ncbi:MAG: VTT domain-containing protein [Candidatus Eisenbacteria bacterium]
MNAQSLWVLCVLLFVDGATFSFATTFLLLEYGKFHPPWQVAVAGGAASAAGSVVQLVLLRFFIHADRPWMRRFVPTRERVSATLAQYPSASFLALMLARATPLPDAPLKLVAAVVGYPLPLYFLAILIGALPYYYVLALVGEKVRVPTWVVIGAMVAIAIGVLVDRWRRSRRSA